MDLRLIQYRHFMQAIHNYSTTITGVIVSQFIPKKQNPCNQVQNPPFRNTLFHRLQNSSTYTRRNPKPAFHLPHFSCSDNVPSQNSNLLIGKRWSRMLLINQLCNFLYNTILVRHRIKNFSHHWTYLYLSQTRPLFHLDLEGGFLVVLGLP
jgi:hypothetical protein